jgi:hypothetical protein
MRFQKSTIVLASSRLRTLVPTLVFTMPYEVSLGASETREKLFSRRRTIPALELPGSNLLPNAGSFIPKAPPTNGFYSPPGTITSVPLQTGLQMAQLSSTTDPLNIPTMDNSLLKKILRAF